MGVAALTPSQLKAAAAALFETATGPGGGGVTFEIVQHSSLQARRGGPLIDIPDPATRFLQNSQIMSLIQRSLASPTRGTIENGLRIYARQFSTPVGVDGYGRYQYWLRVVVDASGRITSAYPTSSAYR